LTEVDEGQYGSVAVADTLGEIVDFIRTTEGFNQLGYAVDTKPLHSFIEGFGGRGYILEPRISGLPIKFERYTMVYFCGTEEELHPIKIHFE
jgi:hypothetical protein